MIAKVTSGASFGGLSRYLHGPGQGAGGEARREAELAGEAAWEERQTENRTERVLWSATRNLAASDPKEIVREMEACAAQSTRTQKAVYHLSISFDEADRPTRAQMEKAADRVLKELGLGRHQAEMVAHGDTKHAHVHIMVNRVDPETGKAWNARGDYARIERALRDLEKEWSMKPVRGHHRRAAGEPAPDRAVARTTGEVQRARRGGPVALADRVRDAVGGRLKAAKTWEELERALKRGGFGVAAKGRGMVITARTAAGVLEQTKASKVDRALGRARLEARFGETLPAYRARTASRDPVRNPVRNPHRGDPVREGEKERGGRLRSGGGRLVRPGRATGRATGRPRRREAAARLRSARVNGPPVRRAGQRLALGSGLGGSGLGGGGREEAEEVRVLKAGMWKTASTAAALVPSKPGRATEARVTEARATEARATGARLSKAQASERRRPLKMALRDPEVRSALQDAFAYARTRRDEQALQASLQKAEALGREIERGSWGARQVPALEASFRRNLVAAYVRPEAAGRAFDEVAAARGAVEAGAALRRVPERFGTLREGGAQAAREAARSGAAYVQAREAARTPVAALRGEQRQAEAAAVRLQTGLAKRPSSRTLAKRLAGRGLAEQSLRRAAAALGRGAPLAREAIQVAMRAVKGPER